MLNPIDSARPHDVSLLESWHARLMVLAWGVILPVGVIVARFFKVTPRQSWPEELDNRAWWYGHLFLQWFGALLSLIGLILILTEMRHVDLFKSPHHFFGWMTIALMMVQIFAGVFRGSKGGPTYPAPDGSWRGDHYDMTRRRKIFEYGHKSLGYVALFTGGLAIWFGLTIANAPVWMWSSISLWWILVLVTALVLQTRKGALDTYKAIWGNDPQLPGNKIKPIGLGVKRQPPKGKPEDI